MKSVVFSRPYVMLDNFVQNVKKKSVKNGVSQFKNFSVNSHKFSKTVLYKSITVRLGCHHRFSARLVPKLLMSEHKTQSLASALFF